MKPVNELQEKISQIWSMVLKSQIVGAQDNFFDLGGDSLKLLRVHAELETYLGSKLSVIDLFQYPTVETLAEHIHRQNA
jgi:acyl carrier protein